MLTIFLCLASLFLVVVLWRVLLVLVLCASLLCGLMLGVLFIAGAVHAAQQPNLPGNVAPAQLEYVRAHCSEPGQWDYTADRGIFCIKSK